MPEANVRPTRTPLSFYALDETVFEVCWHEPPVATPNVPESVVQDVWRLQEFQKEDLRTTDGRRVEVVDPGRLNGDGGPDFLNARLRINGETVAGPVEIHVASAAWYDHGHQRDPAYAGVVLHVTLESDLWTGRVRTSTGRILPEIVLAPRLNQPIRTLLYNFYRRGPAALPCAGRWHTIDPAVTHDWIERLARERLSEKIRMLESRYLERPDHAQLLYELVLTGLGYAKNTVPMLELARRVPIQKLHRLERLDAVQAVLLGTAGLLPDSSALGSLDRPGVDFVMHLNDTFAAWRSREFVEPMLPHQWQFFRLRPSNFPTVRIAQAAALLARETRGPLTPEGAGDIRAALASDRPRSAMERLFRVDPGPFWHAHVRLDRRASRGFPHIGRQRVHALILNAVSPVLQLRAEQDNDEQLASHVHRVLRQLPPENDQITRTFLAMGATANDGLETQGYHQLFRVYCKESRCLQCAVGRALFAGGSGPPPATGA